MIEVKSPLLAERIAKYTEKPRAWKSSHSILSNTILMSLRLFLRSQMPLQGFAGFKNAILCR